MAVRVGIKHSTGELLTVENLTTYSVTENASPLTPADTSGGATTVSLGVQEYDESPMLSGGQLTIYEGDRALVQGDISAPTSDGTTVSIASMSVIAKLNVVRKIAPFTGALDDYIGTLLAAVGGARAVVADAGIAGRHVELPGFNDNVLSRVKELCAAQGVELSDKGDAAYLRFPRERFFDGRDTTATGFSIDNSQLAQSVEVINYNSAWKTNTLIYPEATYDDTTGASTDPGWTPNTSVLTVDAGSVTVIEVPILGSLASVEQPVCMKEVGPTDGVNGSVYSVIGQGSNNNATAGTQASIETLDPAAWTARGGSVTVAVGENYDTIIITITAGSNDPTLAPFAIAMNGGNNTAYSSLRIRGTGVIDHKQKITYPTGLGPTDTTTVVGTTIDSHYVQSRDVAERVAHETMPLFSAPRMTTTAVTDDSGLDIGDIAGARFRQGDTMYRVTSAVSSEGGVSVTAASDTTLDDFDAIWAAKSFDDFDAVWAGRTDLQFAAAPLREA